VGFFAAVNTAIALGRCYEVSDAAMTAVGGASKVLSFRASPTLLAPPTPPRRQGLTATVSRTLTRQSLVEPEPKKWPKSSYIRFAAEQPNETWRPTSATGLLHDQVTHRTHGAACGAACENATRAPTGAGALVVEL
jgi:hypothetical protein